MTLRTESRPFNPTAAKSGAPYGHCDDIFQVAIDHYEPQYATGRVRYAVSDKWKGTTFEAFGNLVMLPIAHSHGKAIYIGDTMYDENGEKFEVEIVHVDQVGFLERCTWPAIDF